MIGTGGTIAGKQTEADALSYDSGILRVDELLESASGISEIATFRALQLANIGSQDMDGDTWVALTTLVDRTANLDDVDGIVITHGTDTLEETAYFLNLSVKTPKPVVLVGAMRPATAVAADGPANLRNAATVASSEEAANRGVLVVVDDKIHLAREVAKRSCSRDDAFESSNCGLAGYVEGRAVRFVANTARLHTWQTEFVFEESTHLPRVTILYGHAGVDPSLVDAAMKRGFLGIVLAGVGEGNAPQPVLAALRAAVGEGVAVVRSSRTGRGFVRRNVEIGDDDAGFISGTDLSPQKARILLMLGLLTTRDPRALQSLFYRY